MALIIKNGSVYFNGEVGKADILINDEGIIEKIAADIRGEEHFDATDRLVIPGLIDPHVHLREPGATHKEDFHTGSRAAVAGGFTTVIDMPNNPLPTVTKARLDEKRELSKKAICDVRFHFGGTDDNFDEVEKAGPDSMKLYLGHTTGELMLKKPDSVERHFSRFPKDRPIVLHASDHSEDEAANIRTTLATIENSVALAQRNERRIHIAHLSIGDEAKITKRYKKCTTETAPHYLFLTSNDAKRLGSGKKGKVLPPLKSDETRKGLWNALAGIDCIATDHAPHTLEDKENGAAGFPGLETSLALMLRAYFERKLSLPWIIDAMSAKPAGIFRISGKGLIAPGYAGDITIVDLRKEWKVAGDELETKCKWSPFEGMELKGKVSAVVRRGELIFEEGEFV